VLRSTAEHPELAFERFSTRKAATRERRSNIDLIPSSSSKLSLLSSSILLIPALGPLPSVWRFFPFTCLPLSLLQLELQSAPLFPSHYHVIQLCRSLSAPTSPTSVETSIITIEIFRAPAFIFFVGKLRNLPSQSSSFALSTSLSSPLPLLRVPTCRRYASAGIPGWRSSQLAAARCCCLRPPSAGLMEGFNDRDTLCMMELNLRHHEISYHTPTAFQ